MLELQDNWVNLQDVIIHNVHCMQSMHPALMTPSLIKPVSPCVYQLTQTFRDHDKWPPLSSHSDTSPSPRSKNVGSYGNANSLEQN